MAYLIDGNNLLGFSFPAHFKDPRYKNKLIRKLLIFQKATRAKVLLIFDGTPPQDFYDEKIQNKKFRVIYPPHGQNADSLIEEIIGQQTDLRKFYVVSSDREIQLSARLKGAKALSSKEFNAELKRVLKENKKAQELEKKVSLPTSLEVKFWLDIFKDKK